MRVTKSFVTFLSLLSPLTAVACAVTPSGTEAVGQSEQATYCPDFERACSADQVATCLDGLNGCRVCACNAAPQTVTSDDYPSAIATDGTTVFWMDSFYPLGDHGDDWMLQTCPVTGCLPTPAALASGTHYTKGHSAVAPSIAVDSTNVYFALDEGIYACAKTGCGDLAKLKPLIADPSPRALATDGTNVYWLHDATVMTCPTTGCTGAPTPIGTALGRALTADSSGVYWFASVASSTAGTTPGQGPVFNTTSLVTCAPAGCGAAPTVVTNVGAAAIALTTDAASVYWVTADAVQSSLKTGSASGPTTIVASKDEGWEWSHIAVDARNVYWTSGSYRFGETSQVSTCPLTGCAGAGAIDWQRLRDRAPILVSEHLGDQDAGDDAGAKPEPAPGAYAIASGGGKIFWTSAVGPTDAKGNVTYGRVMSMASPTL